MHYNINNYGPSFSYVGRTFTGMGRVIRCAGFFTAMKIKQTNRSRFHPNNIRQKLGYRNGTRVVLAVYYPLQRKWKNLT